MCTVRNWSYFRYASLNEWLWWRNLKERSPVDDNSMSLAVRFSYCTVPTFNSCTKCPGNSVIKHDCMPDCHTVSWTWMTSQMNVALVLKLRGPLMCLSFFWLVIHCSFTTRHLQTSGRLMQELNVCTVHQRKCVVFRLFPRFFHDGEIWITQCY